MQSTRLFLALLFFGIVQGYGQVTNSGNLKFFSGSQVAFFGNVTNNGTFVDSGTVVTLAGSGPQTLSGTSSMTFRNLTVNQPVISVITLSQPIQVRGTLTLTSGVIQSTPVNLLTMTSGALAVGASNNSFVSGPLRKTGNQAFTFPVGYNLVYAPISITAPLLVTDQFTATYHQVNPDLFYSVNSKEITIDHVSQCEYWTLDRTTGTSNVSVNLSWDLHSCGVDTPADLRIVRWDGTQWVDEGNGGTSGTPASGTIVSAIPLSSYGQFTLGSISASNILPIELVSFVGVCDDKNITLNWTTASEINCDYFTIERSLDGETWNTIAKVNASGNSSSLVHYAYIDQRTQGDLVYYRINQTDFNGSSGLPTTISVENCVHADTGIELTVYPNPSPGIFHVIYYGNSDAVTSTEIFNSMGERVYAAIGFESMLDLTEYPGGVYTISVFSGDEVITQRIVITD